MADSMWRFLTNDDLRLLEEKAIRRTFKKGYVLVREGCVEQGLFILRHGQVRVEKDSRGAPVQIARLAPEEILGVISFLDGAPASASLVVDDAKTELDYLDGITLNSLLASAPGLATRFYHSLAVVLAKRLNNAMEQMTPPFFS